MGVRDFLFRSLMLESEVASLKEAGLSVGSVSDSIDKEFLDKKLNLFNLEKRRNALKMSRLYSVLHCFENELREFIRETFKEKKKDLREIIPKKVLEKAKKKKERRRRNLVAK